MVILQFWGKEALFEAMKFLDARIYLRGYDGKTIL